MKEELEILKEHFIRIIKLVENDEWHKTEIIIHFAPFINKGIKSLPSFWNKSGERIRLSSKFDDEFLTQFYKFVVKNNQQNEYNQLVFSTVRDKYENCKLDISFNQEVEDTFQSFLPKSKKGKTIPWWKNPSEIVGLVD